jgi:hypothetical protein
VERVTSLSKLNGKQDPEPFDEDDIDVDTAQEVGESRFAGNG